MWPFKKIETPEDLEKAVAECVLERPEPRPKPKQRYEISPAIHSDGTALWQLHLSIQNVTGHPIFGWLDGDWMVTNLIATSESRDVLLAAIEHMKTPKEVIDSE